MYAFNSVSDAPEIPGALRAKTLQGFAGRVVFPQGEEVKMKKNAIRFLVAALALAMLSLPALAQGSSATPAGEGQGQHHGMPSVDERVQHMTKALNLSDDQQTKIKAILTDQRDQMMSLKQDTSTAPTDRRAKFQEIHQNTQQKIRDVLTDDQKTKFDQMQERHREHMMNKGAGQGSTGSSEKQ